jgi:hypothetical protein
MRRVLFLLVPLLVVACDRQPVAPAFEAGPHNTASSWMNNPDNGNIRITRYGTDFAVSWTDPTTGLRATHTTFPIPFGGAPETDCGPQALLDPIAEQDAGLLVDPVFLSDLRANLMGPVWIIVRDVTQAGDCYGARLVAEGMGTVHYTDNDVFSAGPGEPNTNAWGFMATGDLVTVAGVGALYSGHARLAFRQGGDVEVLTSIVNLK